EADGAAADGAVPRHVGDAQRRRGADGGQGTGGVDLVGRQYGRDDLDLVAELLVEQRPDLPVDEAGVERRLSAGPTLAAHERAGDLADGVVALLVLDGERQERHG